MRAIKSGKLYDTDTAEKIFSFRRKVAEAEIVFMPGYSYYSWHYTDIYKTKNGAYFEYDKTAKNITPIAETEAEEIVRNLDADRYIELFGAVPEAQSERRKRYD